MKMNLKVQVALHLINMHSNYTLLRNSGTEQCIDIAIHDTYTTHTCSTDR